MSLSVMPLTRWLRSCTEYFGAHMRHLGADKRAVAIIEMALTAPFLALLIVGLVDTSRYAAAKLKAQQAVNRGLELSMMGGGSVPSSEIQQQAAAQAGVALNEVTVTKFLECSGTTTDWSLSCSSEQESARFTRIQIATGFEPIFAYSSMTKFFFNSDGRIVISVAGVIRIQ